MILRRALRLSYWLCSARRPFKDINQPVPVQSVLREVLSSSEAPLELGKGDADDQISLLPRITSWMATLASSNTAASVAALRSVSACVSYVEYSEASQLKQMVNMASAVFDRQLAMLQPTTELFLERLYHLIALYFRRSKGFYAVVNEEDCQVRLRLISKKLFEYVRAVDISLMLDTANLLNTLDVVFGKIGVLQPSGEFELSHEVAEKQKQLLYDFLKAVLQIKINSDVQATNWLRLSTILLDAKRSMQYELIGPMRKHPESVLARVQEYIKNSQFPKGQCPLQQSVTDYICACTRLSMPIPSRLTARVLTLINS